MAALTVDAGKLISNITLRVSGLRLASFRMRAAALLFRLGARVAGVGIEFEVSRSIVETTKPGDEWRSFEPSSD